LKKLPLAVGLTTVSVVLPLLNRCGSGQIRGAHGPGGGAGCGPVGGFGRGLGGGPGGIGKLSPPSLTYKSQLLAPVLFIVPFRIPFEFCAR
jgi:hypothetical protein